jgi:hypothetical protein
VTADEEKAENNLPHSHMAADQNPVAGLPNHISSAQSHDFLSLRFPRNSQLYNHGLVELLTRYLLISRIPINYTLDQILENLEVIEKTLQGPDMDTAEFQRRFEKKDRAFFQKHGNKVSIVIQLKSEAFFSTAGSFNSLNLPMFFFTIKSSGVYQDFPVQNLPYFIAWVRAHRRLA